VADGRARRDVFISYASADEPWATWIAWHRNQALIDEAAKAEPDEEAVQFNSDSLWKTAQRIAPAVPAIATTVEQVRSLVESLFR
jgi:hypothetical protein